MTYIRPEGGRDVSKRVVRIVAVLSSPDSITDAELEDIAQKAIDETYLDIEECSIEVTDSDSGVVVTAPNAIERLRVKPATVGDWHQRAEDLAAVDALYQDMKRIADGSWQREAHGRPGAIYDVAEFAAAAVRRVEGQA